MAYLNDVPAVPDDAPTVLKVTKVHGRELYPRERQWLEAYVQCNNASEASRMIGITKCVAQYGQQMRMKLADYIVANLKQMIGRTAPAALETVFDLAQSCEDPKVRLAAAQDLLNRAGFKESTHIELSVKDKSKEEIDKEIDALLQKGGIVIGDVVTDAEVVNE